MYKHLMIIEDGESVENSLHLTDTARAERLIELIKNNDIGGGELSDEAEEAMREADEEAAQADYPAGVSPTSLAPEDYVDVLQDLLSNNDLDVYLDELEIPDEVSTE
jgi:hypothetical protein